MVETNPVGEPVSAELPRVIRVRPGSSSEKDVLAILPANLHQSSIRDVLKYVTTDEGLSRKDERIVGRIRQEMSGSYGVTIGASPARLDDGIGGYFAPQKSEAGKEYLLADITVAANESGGSLDRLLRVYSWA